MSNGSDTHKSFPDAVAVLGQKNYQYAILMKDGTVQFWSMAEGKGKAKQLTKGFNYSSPYLQLENMQKIAPGVTGCQFVSGVLQITLKCPKKVTPGFCGMYNQSLSTTTESFPNAVAVIGQNGYKYAILMKDGTIEYWDLSSSKGEAKKLKDPFTFKNI